MFALASTGSRNVRYVPTRKIIIIRLVLMRAKVVPGHHGIECLLYDLHSKYYGVSRTYGGNLSAFLQ